MDDGKHAQCPPAIGTMTKRRPSLHEQAVLMSVKVVWTWFGRPSFALSLCFSLSQIQDTDCFCQHVTTPFLFSFFPPHLHYP